MHEFGLNFGVSQTSHKVAAMINHNRTDGLNPYYAGYFDYFNRGLFYESHDVLEQLWLADRNGPNYSFYKGLIQLSGAFVHLQKNRLRPAAALFKLAQANLAKYPPHHEHLDVAHVLAIIEHWLTAVEQGNFIINPLHGTHGPKIGLLGNSRQ